MSKLIALFTICCILVFALGADSSQEKLWNKWDKNLLLTSKKENKLILLKVIKDNCHYCSDMEKNVFSKASMHAFVKDKFLPVSVNISHEKMPLGLKYSVTPSFYFITWEKKVVKKVVGSWNSDDFRAFLDTILKAR